MLAKGEQKNGHNGQVPRLGFAGDSERRRELSTSTTKSAASIASNISFALPDAPKLLGVLHQLVRRTPVG